MDEEKLHEILGQDVEVPDIVDKKLEQAYTQLEGRQPPAKGRRPFMKTVLIAAVLMVAGALCIAAGVPDQVYNFLNGGFLRVMPEGMTSSMANGVIGGGSMTISGAGSAPLVLEDGRLWFVNSGERTDITDLIDENTPYIYEHTDPATQNTGYVIMGGTVDDFGWAEYAVLDMGSGMTGSNFCQQYVILDGERLLPSELTDEQWERARALTAAPPEENTDTPSPLQYETVYAPWLEAAMEQLGIQRY